MKDILEIIYKHPFITFFLIIAIGISLSMIISAVLSPFDPNGGTKAQAQAEADKAFWNHK